MNVFQDKDGNWKAIRTFTLPNGAQGCEHRVLIKRSQDPFADAARHDEAQALADAWAEASG